MIHEFSLGFSFVYISPGGGHFLLHLNVPMQCIDVFHCIASFAAMLSDLFLALDGRGIYQLIARYWQNKFPTGIMQVAMKHTLECIFVFRMERVLTGRYR